MFRNKIGILTCSIPGICCASAIIYEKHYVPKQLQSHFQVVQSPATNKITLTYLTPYHSIQHIQTQQVVFDYSKLHEQIRILSKPTSNSITLQFGYWCYQFYQQHVVPFFFTSDQLSQQGLHQLAKALEYSTQPNEIHMIYYNVLHEWIQSQKAIFHFYTTQPPTIPYHLNGTLIRHPFDIDRNPTTFIKTIAKTKGITLVETEIQYIEEHVGNNLNDIYSVVNHMDTQSTTAEEACSIMTQQMQDQLCKFLKEPEIELNRWYMLERICDLQSFTVKSLSLPEHNQPKGCVDPTEVYLATDGTNRSKNNEAIELLLSNQFVELQPKQSIDIQPLPTSLYQLISPCWFYIRPLVKRAFLELWNKEEMIHQVRKVQMRLDKEELQYHVNELATEIDNAEYELEKAKILFKIKLPTLTSVQRATMNAELSLLEDALVSKKQFYRNFKERIASQFP